MSNYQSTELYHRKFDGVLETYGQSSNIKPLIALASVSQNGKYLVKSRPAPHMSDYQSTSGEDTSNSHSTELVSGEGRIDFALEKYKVKWLKHLCSCYRIGICSTQRKFDFVREKFELFAE